MPGPQPGRMDQRVLFRQRAIGDDGERSGAFADAFRAWGAWRPLSAAQIVEAGAPTDAVTGTLTIPDTARGRTLDELDRAVVGGQDLCIVSAPVPDHSGFLLLQLSRKIAG